MVNARASKGHTSKSEVSPANDYSCFADCKSQPFVPGRLWTEGETTFLASRLHESCPETDLEKIDTHRGSTKRDPPTFAPGVSAAYCVLVKDPVAGESSD